MENQVLAATHELEAGKARINDLEQQLTKRDLNLAEQKRMINKIKVK